MTTIAQSLLPELDQEMANTRKTLARVPDASLTWQPHPKSMSLGSLASHLAELVSWGAATLATTEFDLAPPGGEPWKPAEHGSAAAILAAFDRHVVATRAALAAAPDSELMVPWSLKSGGQAIFTLPRIAVLRSMIFNHVVHHRGQLTVYYRLLGVPVPALYGPSADES